MAKFPMAITPYYASLIQKPAITDPVFRMAVPQLDELMDSPFLKDDPFDEGRHTPVPHLVRRYTDRALLIATTRCAVYCRHCTRKRIAGQGESCISSEHLQSAALYLKSHPEIHDVIISGGDPLTMPTSAIEQILTAVTLVPSVRIVRLGTRTPVVLPMRITDELVAMLAHFKPLYVNTHFNHPVELTPQAEAACARLVDAGIPINNQTVLLHGVNDNAKVLEDLCRGLVRNRIRPYYLFQCDLVRGVEHFRTPVLRGIQIMEYLRGQLEDIPDFVVDVPNGSGKIPLTPSYILSISSTQTVLRNHEGTPVSYPEPSPDAFRLSTERSASSSILAEEMR
jgi:lysine 2,3-aminomutase